jgi:glutaredoxin
VKIEVVISGIEGCSSCEKAKRLVKDIIEDAEGIEFGEINSLEEPEKIQSLGMVTSGAIVINNKIEFSSLPKESVLRKRISEIYESR